MKCSCSAKSLFDFGCKCGAFQFENANHVWFNGAIYGIGKTAEEAEKLSRSYLQDFDNYDPDWILGRWSVIPDNEVIPIVTDEDDEPDIFYAWEWIRYYGLGYLGAV